MIISEKMKPVIAILFIILLILVGVRLSQNIQVKPKAQVNTAAQEMLNAWTSYMIDLQKHIDSDITFSVSNISSDISFDIDKSGEISNIKLIESSNNERFDEQMLNAVEKASPCAPLPEKYTGKGITVNITLGKDIVGSQIVKEW